MPGYKWSRDAKTHEFLRIIASFCRLFRSYVYREDSGQWTVNSDRILLAGDEGIMREGQRRTARRNLDEELRPFRRALKDKNPTGGLLRVVRQALGIPVAEIAGKMRVNRSVVFEIEAGEKKCTVSLNSMLRVAAAMGCKVVYGIVPEDGRTLEELAEERLWEKVLGERG